MTDEPARVPNADPTRSPPSRVQADVSDVARKRDFLPILYLVGFVVLAGSIVYLWRHPTDEQATAQQAGKVDTLQAQIATLRDQVARLEQRPAGPASADVAKLQAQVTALDGRPSVAPAAIAALTAQLGGLADRISPLGDKVDALEKRPVADPAATQQLTDKMAAIEARKIVTPEQLSLLSDQVQSVGRQIPDVKPLEEKVAGLERRPAYDPAATDAKFTDIGGKLQQALAADGTLGTRLDGVEKQQAALTDQLKTLTQRSQITARLQSMATALAAGQKLGDIPGAPPALARFASEAPPTEASLRESFDRYADAAQRASQPAITDDQNFGSRLWTRAQQAVTVRQGERVLVGDPIAGVMARAKEKLDNGDLAGSVDALKGLAGPAAAAMQPWTDRAQSLVAARSAIASLATN